jgi:hypothetical protein
MSWTHPVDAEGKTGMKADAKYNFMAGAYFEGKSSLLMARYYQWTAVKMGASTLVAASVAATAALFL